ncbi:MAG: UDP-N-acetylglucosamine 2-epimerase (non-hydrolyzing) [Planctomycetia bacterium]|nr:UDP-N-acetylglucosamine 2-epimerase (non-hydrolyzing) [Planctomycetia bacterium]
MQTIMHIVGARPNFMKVAPVMAAMAKRPGEFRQVLVHTGQHYDRNMSDVFLEQLGMPQPDEFLGIGSGTHAEQTAKVMLGFEPALAKHRPDWVVVVGDVNSTLACALVAAKRGVRVAHVEAGLRSGDWTMPEEVNRVLTDRLSDLLLTPSEDGDRNLLREGIGEARIRRVGNVMIDSLVRLLPEARKTPLVHELGLVRERFVLVTLHRPDNVDDPAALRVILDALAAIARAMPVVFPVHPRTRKQIQAAGLESAAGSIRFLEPLGYLDFLGLTDAARVVITDSGGVQEETTYLGVPCLTLRPNTERPVTIERGTNRLVARAGPAVARAFESAIADPARKTCAVPLWDGGAADRITDAIAAAGPRSAGR